ncbi:MAG: PQQ-binding-like beta-propeller repeat protein, partial [Beijerinckiaceae bacterium]|nr:PQQ-binding-like beta-propeller repeat protein [Beijerinckiaceae bacterium]
MRANLKMFAALVLSLSFIATAKAQEPWPTYRYDNARTGVQPFASSLSDPAKAATLSVKWSFPKLGPHQSYRASPIVARDTVFIGNLNGYFYALDAASGVLKWQYPLKSSPPLLGTCGLGGHGGFGRYGIASSAAFTSIGGQDAIIFGAPDPTAEGGLGSGALFALDMAGNVIWKSEVVAHVTGCTVGNKSEL